MNESASAVALSGAGNGDPLVIRKVTTQTDNQPQDPLGSKANPTTANESSNTERMKRRWRIRRVSQRVLCGALPEEERPRIVRCGWSMGALVSLLGASGHRASWSGVESCNSVWCCPVCSARIREGRRSEIQSGFEASKKLGWKSYFITFTVPHSISTSLNESLGGLREAYKKMRRYSSLKGFFSKVEGVITSTEIQVGSSGFHPHRHAIFFTSSPITKDEVTSIKKAWGKAVVKEGLAKPSEAVGVVVEEATTSGISAYLSKIQENKVSLEMARSDLKSGRFNDAAEWHCAPFDLLDRDIDLPISMAQRQRLWVEYYEGSKGISAIRWSRGLKKKLSINEVSDDELGTLSPEEAEAELRFLKKQYNLLFKEKPSLLAQCQALFREEKYKEAAALVEGYGELILDDGTLLDTNTELPPDPWARASVVL